MLLFKKRKNGCDRIRLRTYTIPYYIKTSATILSRSNLSKLATNRNLKKKKKQLVYPKYAKNFIFEKNT